MSQERVPRSSRRFTECLLGGLPGGKGAVQVCCAGRAGVARAHLTASVCSSFQHPGDRLPPSARVAALPPVRRLRAADRGAAQAPPPRALRDGRQPRGRQGSDGRPPCRPGTDLRSGPLLPSWASGPRLLLGCCLALMRLRCVSQLPVPPRDGKSEMECRQLIKPLRTRKKVFLTCIRIEAKLMLSSSSSF